MQIITDEQNWCELVDLLRARGLRFDAGLSHREIERTQSRFGLRFPPDLRAFLQVALPTGKGFPDWRSGSEEEIRDRLDWPTDGCRFDVEHNAFWLPEWGPRPEMLAAALEVATRKIAEAPKLIPIYSHRYIPEEPCASGNPVFSVHQMDIIYYGFDLDDYFRHEFNLHGRKQRPAQVRPIPFWEPAKF